jgi:glutathione S-transferase
MRLYYHPCSSNVRRVLLVAAHLGVQLEKVEVDLMSEADRARLVEINPNSKIPVLDDGGFLLWESNAIVQYLCERTPGQALYPQDPAARADVNRWLFWCAQHFSPAVSILTWERLWKGLVGAGEADPVEVAKGEQQFAQFAAVLEGHLSRQAWLSGGAVSLADFSVAAPLMYIERARLPVDLYPHLQKWMETVKKLPAWAETEAIW